MNGPLWRYLLVKPLKKKSQRKYTNNKCLSFVRVPFCLVYRVTIFFTHARILRQRKQGRRFQRQLAILYSIESGHWDICRAEVGKDPVRNWIPSFWTSTTPRFQVSRQLRLWKTRLSLLAKSSSTSLNLDGLFFSTILFLSSVCLGWK